MSMPAVDCLLTRKRLVYVAGLVREAPPVLGALLGLDMLHDTAGSLNFSWPDRMLPWLSLVKADLVVLWRRVSQLRDMPDPAAQPGQWFCFVCQWPHQWKQIVDKLVFFESACAAAVPIASPGIDLPAKHQCLECNLEFRSWKALALHNRVKHGCRTELRRYIGGDGICPHCCTHFGSRLAVVRHLSDPRRVLQCREFVLPGQVI